jgi:hypothetical protein
MLAVILFLVILFLSSSGAAYAGWAGSTAECGQAAGRCGWPDRGRQDQLRPRVGRAVRVLGCSHSPSRLCGVPIRRTTSTVQPPGARPAIGDVSILPQVRALLVRNDGNIRPRPAAPSECAKGGTRKTPRCRLHRAAVRLAGAAVITPASGRSCPAYAHSANFSAWLGHKSHASRKESCRSAP